MIIVAAAPLLALRFDDERIDGSRLAGLLLGLARRRARRAPATGSSEELLGAGAVLLSAFCYAVGPMILQRRLADLDPRARWGGALAVAAGVLTPAALIASPPAAPGARRSRPRFELGIFCTAAALAF